jgi:hypothetical protein
MIVDRQKIEERIAQLTRQRDAFVSEANLGVARLNGMIAAYETIWRELGETAVEPDAAQEPEGD